MRNEVLTNADPKLIIWFSFYGTYGQTGSDTYSIYPTGADAAARWNGLSEAIQAPLPGGSTSGQTPHLTTSTPIAARSHRARAHVALLKRRRHHHRRHHRRHRQHRRVKHA